MRGQSFPSRGLPNSCDQPDACVLTFRVGTSTTSRGVVRCRVHDVRFRWVVVRFRLQSPPGPMTNVEDVDRIERDREQHAIAPVDQLPDLEFGAALGGERAPLGKLFEGLRRLQESATPLGGARGGVVPDVLIDGRRSASASAVISTFMTADEIRERVGEGARPPGLDVLEATANALERLRAIDGFEQCLIRLGVLDDDFGAAVDGEHVGPAGLL